MADAVDIQNKALEFATTMSNNAVTNVNNMTELLNNLPFVDSSVGAVSAPTVYGGYSWWGAPEAPNVADSAFDGLSAPNAPQAPTFTTPNIGVIPEFTLVEPVLNFPQAPDTTIPDAPGAAPVFQMPATPSAPSFTLPDAPTFAPVSIPDSPIVEVPLFDMEADFGDVVAPTERFTYAEKEYQSALLDETKAKLLNDIRNGGYGIDDADERRLWDRARERELEAASAKMAEAARMAAARGFRLPTGTLVAQQDAAQQEFIAKSSTLSRDIAIKRADMYVENRRFTITSAIQLEDILIRAFAATAERFLNAARAQVEMDVLVFNAQAARFNAKVEAYRSYAAAFESRIRAALSSVEIYKAKIEAARLTAETQKTYADIYQTQINGVNALINLYNSELESAKTFAQIEQLRLQAFKSEVEVYGERVRAKAIEFDMYEAQIKGETSKVQAYEASARAYAAKINGFEARARTAEVTARTEIAQAQTNLEVYRTDMERYRTEIGRVTEKIRAQLDEYRSEIQGFAAFASVVQTDQENNTRVSEANARLYIEAQRVSAENVRNRIDAAIKAADVAMSNQNSAASVMGSLGSGWAAAVNSLTATIETA